MAAQLAKPLPLQAKEASQAFLAAQDLTTAFREAVAEHNSKRSEWAAKADAAMIEAQRLGDLCKMLAQKLREAEEMEKERKSHWLRIETAVAAGVSTVPKIKAAPPASVPAVADAAAPAAQIR